MKLQKIKSTQRVALASLASLALGSGTVMAQKTFSGASKSNGDNWNVSGNWTSSGVPSGAVNVIIPASKYVTADTNTPAYTGNLSIGAGASLQCGYGGSNGLTFMNALGNAASTTITMEAGSAITLRGNYTPAIPAMVLNGDVSLTIGASSSGGPDPTFSKGISGAHTVYLEGKGDSFMTLDTVANTFDGLIVQPIVSTGLNISANVAGALGTGDVTIRADQNGGISANLTLGATSAIASTATLSLYGPASATKLKLTADNTVRRLVVDGVTQPVGTYGKTGSGAQFEVSWINSTSTATLNVTGAPSQFWDLDDSTPGAGSTAGDASGTWDGSNTFWNNAAGDGTAITWTSGQQAVFAAGSDATAPYTVTVSGTRDIGGLFFKEGTVTLSGGGLRMTSDSIVTVNSGLTAAISAPISNDIARKLIKVGNGRLTLSGTNTYTGLTRADQGILSVASLADAGSDSPIGNYPTAGAGGLLLGGGGIFQYTGGTTTVNRGFSVAGDSSIDIPTASAALKLGDVESVNQPGSLTVTGGAGSTLTIGRARIVEGAQLTLNPTTASMIVGSADGYTSYNQSSTLTLGGTATGNSVTGVISQTNPPGSAFSQSLALIKSGSSDWTLNGVSTYSGNTTVNAGSLIAGTNALNNANGAFGKQNNVEIPLGVANSSNDAGILIGGAYTIGRAIRIKSQNTTDSGTRVITLGGTTANSSIYSAPIYLGDNNNAGYGVTLTAASGGDVTFSGGIADPSGMDPSSYTVTKAGDGTVNISTASYSGNTTVTAGTLSVGNGTTNINFGDYAAVSVASGAILNLNYTGSDFVLNLNLGGSPAAVGEWGAVGSGAVNQSALLTGSGRLINGSGVLANIFLWDGGSSDIGGNGDLGSAGGSGTWNTAIKNWDIGVTPYAAWGNTTGDKAVFGGSAGTVTLGANMSIGELEINAPSNSGTGYFIGEATEDNTLTFGGTKTLTVINNGTGTNQDATIYAGIAGSPNLNITGRATNSVNSFSLLPTSSVTMTLGSVNMLNTFGSNKRLILGGESTGNVADDVTWNSGSNQLMLTKAGTGSWTINQDVLGSTSAGRLYVEQGTLTLGGTNNYFTHKVGVSTVRESTFTASGTASKLEAKGTFTIGDNREFFYVQNLGTISPGPGVQTLNVRWNANSSSSTANGAFNMQTGSTYEWDVASNVSTDVIDVQTGGSNNGNLILGNITLKIKDGGASTAISNTDKLTVFTYETGAQAVVRSIGTVSFDTSALGAGWTVGTLALTDDGAGKIYLTGLSFASGGTPYDTWASDNGLMGANSLLTADVEGGGAGDGLSNLLEFAFGTNPNVSDLGPLSWAGGMSLAVPGTPAVDLSYPGGGGVDFKARFMRRKDFGTTGSASYAWEFSSNLSDWESSADVSPPTWYVAPTVLADDASGDYELVEVPYPLILDNGKKAQYFRVSVSAE